MEDEEMTLCEGSLDSVEIIDGDYVVSVKDCTPGGQQHQSDSQDRSEKQQKGRKRDQKLESKVGSLVAQQQTLSQAQEDIFT